MIQLRGFDAPRVIEALTGRDAKPSCYVASFEGIDEALVARLRDDWWQLMPHGGPRVIQRLIETLEGAGVRRAVEPDAREVYPEASSALEADMLVTLARAASPAAVDLLLDQPRRWCDALALGKLDGDSVLRSSVALDRLVTPPTVALVGRPNVGKSTLT
ncbi:MAG: hypothetical protein ACYTGQ_08880, partial [Planctomycetota bacterium]